MNDTQHLADLRERFGPNATRVGDPPTAGDVALLLATIDELECALDDEENSHQETMAMLQLQELRNK